MGIKIEGLLIAKMNSEDPLIQHIDIIKIIDEFRPLGPAENSILIVETLKNGNQRSSYIPWVGYFDVDREKSKNPLLWEIVEPAQEYNRENVYWIPFLK